MTNYLPILDDDVVYCDVTGFDRTLFNLKLRVYREPDFKSKMGFRYYLVDFFFAVYFQGPLFWQGMRVERGTDAQMAELAPFALDRQNEMRAEGRDHYPKLYRIHSTDCGLLNVIAGACRVYAFDSPEPLSFTGTDGLWFANWDIIFEEGYAGQAEGHF